MEFILRQIHNAGSFSWLYLANLFLGFHFFSVQYVHSSFLSEFLSEAQIGLLYTMAAGLTLVSVAATGLVLSRYGNYKVALVGACISLFAMLGLATTSDPGLRVVFFALHTLIVPVILFTLDVYLENYTKDENNTGNSRGIFLSIATLAALFSPVLAGQLLGDTSAYQRVYMVSALFILPFLIILMTHLRTFKDPIYRIFNPFRTFMSVVRDGDTFHIAMAQFLLRFYFAWMVIYLPLFLHQHIGFSWPEVGTVLFIMLVPYILIEWPAGIIADNWIGEKELLFAGFVITALATAALVLIDTPSILLWGSVLFFTRVGAALIESMTETYFFKHIDGDDTDMLAFFRILRPLAYTIAPLVATGVLILTGPQTMWLVLATIMLYGTIHAYRLHDTR